MFGAVRQGVVRHGRVIFKLNFGLVGLGLARHGEVRRGRVCLYLS